MSTQSESANPPPALALDVTAAVYARMQERASPADSQRLAHPARATPEVKEALLRLLLPSVVEEAIHLYQRCPRRGLMLCDQAHPESRVLWLSAEQLAAALPRVPPAAQTEIVEMLRLYVPSETAVIVMLTAQSVQPLLAFRDERLFSPGTYALMRVTDVTGTATIQTGEELLAEIATLHARLHQADAPPVTEEEQQAAWVMQQLQQRVLALIQAGIHPQLLELSLFYLWLRLTTLPPGRDDTRFLALSADLPGVRGKLVKRLEQLAPQFQDEGATLEMERLGEKLQALKNLAQMQAAQPLERRAAEQQTDQTNRTLFAFVREGLTQRIAPALLAQGFLYSWLRLSTINANAPEAFFQKLERHWPEVGAQVWAWAQKL
jgi:hypothetical protein